MKGRIKNDHDWFLVSVCEQLEIVGRPKRNSRRRCITWVNTLLVHALGISQAYDKALSIARDGLHRYKAVSGDICYWKVVGIWDVLPVYDNIADGEELYWTDYGNMSVSKARSFCSSKRDLLKRRVNSVASIKKSKS